MAKPCVRRAFVCLPLTHAKPVLTVALHGHLTAQFGLGGGAAATSRLLQSVGCHVQPRDLQLATHAAQAGSPTPEPEPALRPQLDLVHTNPNLLAANPDLLKIADLTAPLRIGFWAWELEAFPEGWEPFFDDYDEIWCPSPFCAQALSQRSPVPVVAVPHLPDWPRLDVLRERRGPRARNRQPFRFLSLFDFWSTPDRKNPLGSIQAFQGAFPLDDAEGPNVELLIKTSSAQQFPQACQQLMAITEADPRIHWQHQHLSTAALDDLLLSADALLSLHRSEGFGLVLADAMAMELPVIATGYSGNLEFMPPGSAMLVPWQPQAITRTCGDYRLGWTWAEPDLAAAAEAMRALVHDPVAAATIARAGADAVRERLSADRLGSIVRQRLGTLILKPSRREWKQGLDPGLTALG